MQHIKHEQTDAHVSSRQMPASTRLRRMLADQGSIVIAPGVYDGITARLALAAGFKCLYMTGVGTSMSRLGMADLGLVTFSDMLDNATMLAGLDPSVPVIAVAGAGYGGPIMVHRIVQAYARAGVAALHLEDEVTEKRGRQLLQRQLVDREEWYAKLRAAVAARDEIGSDMIIVASTIANGAVGFDEAIARLRGAHECGVDALFLDTPKNKDECQRACDIFGPAGMPMLLNVGPNGFMPDTTAEEARALGFRIVIWPTAVLDAVFAGGVKALNTLKTEGKSAAQLMRPGEIFRICGLSESLAIDKRAGGEASGDE